MKREVIIVGGGVAGIQTALRLADRGIRPTIVEKEPDLGGKLRGWYHLFPSLRLRPRCFPSCVADWRHAMSK